MEIRGEMHQGTSGSNNFYSLDISLHEAKVTDV